MARKLNEKKIVENCDELKNMANNFLNENESILKVYRKDGGYFADMYCKKHGCFTVKLLKGSLKIRKTKGFCLECNPRYRRDRNSKYKLLKEFDLRNIEENFSINKKCNYICNKCGRKYELRLNDLTKRGRNWKCECEKLKIKEKEIKELLTNTEELVDFKKIDGGWELIINCKKHGEYKIELQHKKNYCKNNKPSCKKCKEELRLKEVEDEFRCNLKENDELIKVFYKNGEWRADIKCKKHGIYTVRKRAYCNDKSVGCVKCYENKLKLNLEEYCEKFKGILNEEHELLEVYKDENSKKRGERNVVGRIKCKKCDSEFKKDFYSYKNSGRKCPYCNDKKDKILNNLNKEENIEIVKEVDDGYIIKFKCGHGENLLVNYTNRVPKCGFCKTKEKWEERLKEQNKSGLKTEKVFIDNGVWKADLCCNKHGLFTTNLKHYKENSYCEQCNYENNKNEVYNNALLYLKENEELLDVFYDSGWKLKLLCKKHNHEFIARYSKHQKFGGCNICNRSRGESRIAKYLTDNNIDFLEEHKFDGMIYKNNLRFDFYLPEYNIAIEYDGKQHFEITGFGSGKEEAVRKYKNTKKRDYIKNKYCEDNGIKLIRISYTDFDNIEKILDKRLDEK